LGKIINIRGTNGSGKSEVVKDLFRRFEYKVYDDAVYIPDLDLVVVGRYFGSRGLIPTGGCDQLRIGRVVEIIEKSALLHNVLFEGAKESRTYKRWMDYPDMNFVYLNTPLPQCIKWRAKRRTADMPYDDHTLIDGYYKTHKTRFHFIDAGFPVYSISPDNCRKLVLQLLDEGQDMQRSLRELSGSGKRTHTTRMGLYSSMNFFPDLPAVRDTALRFQEFGINLLEGSVLDVGSNVGALSFEAAKRGGKVQGYEYSWERVQFTNKLARQKGAPCRFTQVDLRQYLPKRRAQFVFCCSVDEYIKDRQLFYNWLWEVTLDTLFFECNVQKGQTVDDTIRMLKKARFETVEHLGSGDDGGISRKRRIYRCKSGKEMVNS
jgi:2-polyprenyl-3-methyl-5-hydroxy-6-metoxy-1,4-benzoquinol methylase